MNKILSLDPNGIPKIDDFSTQKTTTNKHLSDFENPL